MADSFANQGVPHVMARCKLGPIALRRAGLCIGRLIKTPSECTRI